MTSNPPAESGAVIHAAGGLVWRSSERGRELAVIRRNRYGEEWTLPKGKLQPGEDWEAAAIREVLEETGCEVELRSFAGGDIYLAQGHPKIVLYWHMVVRRAGLVVDREEAREVEWLPPEDALVRLTHESGRRVLRDSLPSAPNLT